MIYCGLAMIHDILRLNVAICAMVLLVRSLWVGIQRQLSHAAVVTLNCCIDIGLTVLLGWT